MNTAGNNVVVRFPSDSDQGPILIPEGEYRLTFRRYRRLKRFKRGVLELWFTVADMGEHFEKHLVRRYNVRVSDRMRSFTARPCSDFAREYVLLFGRTPRYGAAPLEDFKRHLLIGRVETTKRDYRQKPLPPSLWYSQIRVLTGIEQ